MTPKQDNAETLYRKEIDRLQKLKDKSIENDDQWDFHVYDDEQQIWIEALKILLEHTPTTNTQSDAIDFAEWLLKKGSGEGNPISRREDTEKLYKSFLAENPPTKK